MGLVAERLDCFVLICLFADLMANIHFLDREICLRAGYAFHKVSV